MHRVPHTGLTPPAVARQLERVVRPRLRDLHAFDSGVTPRTLAYQSSAEPEAGLAQTDWRTHARVLQASRLMASSSCPKRASLARCAAWRPERALPARPAEWERRCRAARPPTDCQAQHCGAQRQPRTDQVSAWRADADLGSIRLWRTALRAQVLDENAARGLAALGVVIWGKRTVPRRRNLTGSPCPKTRRLLSMARAQVARISRPNVRAEPTAEAGTVRLG
jgi:hypothetical protein